MGCRRFQFIYQATFVEFSDAVHKHLACVVCGQGAWCRDLVVRPDGVRCAYRAHRHPLEACDDPPAVGELGCHECGRPVECIVCESCPAHCIPGRSNDVLAHFDAFEQIIRPKRTGS
jgi:hypothetical protein